MSGMKNGLKLISPSRKLSKPQNSPRMGCHSVVLSQIHFLLLFFSSLFFIFTPIMLYYVAMLSCQDEAHRSAYSIFWA